MASQIVYTPKVCTRHQDEKTQEWIEPTFSGSVTLRKPTFDEKYEYLEQSGIKHDAQGNMIPISESKDRIALMRKGVQLARKHYLAVDLTHLESQEKITSIDELETSDHADAILIEIGMLVFSGFRLGNG